MKFVIVDGSPVDRERIRGALGFEFSGSTFIEIADRKSLDEALARSGIDAVITEYRLIGSDGIEILETVKQRLPHVPVIMVTDAGGEEAAVEGMKAGLADYVPKRSLDRLPAAVRDGIERARSRKEMDDAIRELRTDESRFRVMSELTSDCAFSSRIREDGTIEPEWVTEAIERISGYSFVEAEARGGPFHLFHPEDEPIAREAIGRLIEGRPSMTELRILAKDGTARWIRLYARPVWDAARSRVVRIQGVARDISDRKRDEEALRQAKEYSENLIRTANVMIVGLTGAGEIRVFNEAAEKITGYTRDEMEGLDWFATIVPRDRYPGVWEMFSRWGGGGWLPRTFENPIVTKAGEERFISWQNSQVVENGRVTGSISFGIDVTQRVRMEEALRRAEEKYRGIFENAVEGIFQSEPGGRLVTANPSLARMLGYDSPEDLIARVSRIEHLVVEPEKRSELARLLREASLVKGFECEYHRKSGGRIWASLNARVVRDTSGRALTVEGSIEDTTERRRAEEALRKSEDLLRQSRKMEAVGRLAGGVAHDFNNLLTTILGNADMLLRRLPPDDPNRVKARTIQDTASRGAKVTRQLLAFSRRQVLAPAIVNLNDAIRALSDTLSRPVGENVVQRLRLAPDLRPVKADPGQIEQVILNLMLNARDAMPGGGRLSITTENVVLAERDCPLFPGLEPGKFDVLAVSDTGAGMSGEVMEHLFEPFFTTKADGTGLGLSTVYGIVHSLGGHVSAESRVGLGTTFRVYLPSLAGTTGAAESTRDAATGDEGEAPRGRETILLVEDDPGVRAHLLEVLEGLGYTVPCAPNAEEALRIVRNDGGLAIDILLSDVVLPGRSGTDLARELREAQPGLKVLFISGYAGQSAEALDGLLTGSCFLPKPFTVSILAQAIREALGTPSFPTPTLNPIPIPKAGP